MGSVTQFLLLAIMGLSIHRYSMAEATCDPKEDILEMKDFTIINMLDDHGEWKTIVRSLLDKNAKISPRIHLKQKKIMRDGRKVVVSEVNIEVTPKPKDVLLFNNGGARNVVVFNNGKSARRIRADTEEGYGGVLTNRALKENEVFQVRIDKLMTKWFFNLGIGLAWADPDSIAYGKWMNSNTIMLYNNKVYTSGLITKTFYGTNLRNIKEGDVIGVTRMKNGNVHFFLNGEDFGIATIAIKNVVYGVVDMFGNCVQVSIVDSKLFKKGPQHHH